MEHQHHHYYGKSGSLSSSSNNNNNNNSGRNLNLSTQELFSSANIGEIPNNESMDNILDDLLQDTQTHNYLHQLHTEIFSPQNEEKSSENDNESTQVLQQTSKKRGRGGRGDNKEAVRKYREKLKAREAMLEDEINKLKAANQELSKRLEGEAAMQAEICWLKCLLVDIRGRIEGETCSYRFYKSFNNGTRFHGHDNLKKRCGQCRVDGKTTQSRMKLSNQVSNNGAEIDNFNHTPSLGSEPKQFLSFTRDI